MFRDQMHYAEIPDLVPIVLPLRGKFRPLSQRPILTPFFTKRPFGRVRQRDLVPKMRLPTIWLNASDRHGSVTAVLLTSTRHDTGSITFILYI